MAALENDATTLATLNSLGGRLERLTFYLAGSVDAGNAGSPSSGRDLQDALSRQEGKSVKAQMTGLERKLDGLCMRSTAAKDLLHLRMSCHLPDSSSSSHI